MLEHWTDILLDLNTLDRWESIGYARISKCCGEFVAHGFGGTLLNYCSFCQKPV